MSEETEKLKAEKVLKIERGYPETELEVVRGYVDKNGRKVEGYIRKKPSCRENPTPKQLEHRRDFTLAAFTTFGVKGKDIIEKDGKIKEVPTAVKLIGEMTKKEEKEKRKKKYEEYEWYKKLVLELKELASSPLFLVLFCGFFNFFYFFVS
jgi:hypothetical protein